MSQSDAPTQTIAEEYQLKEWLDNSKREDLHRCPRYFFYRHELHLVTKHRSYANPMQYGVALHKALESLHDGSAFERVTCPCPDMAGCNFCGGGTIQKIFAQFLLYYPFDPEDPKEMRTRQRGCQLLTEYVRKYKNSLREMKVIATEVAFVIHFGEFDFIGRIDAILLNVARGKFFPRDFKTTSRFGAQFINQFHLGGQMTGYILAVEQILECEVEEAEIDGLRTTTKIDEDSFLRVETSRTPEEKELWKREVLHDWETIKQAREKNFWVRHTNSCWDYNRQCEYWGICMSAESEQKGMIEDNYEVEEWVPVEISR